MEKRKSMEGYIPEDGVEDMTILTNIDEHGINLNLKCRYAQDNIYTYAGTILISVNPYKDLPIYNTEYVLKYQGQGCQLSAQEPHIYAVTEAMYSQLKSANQSQSCVISGESGAGKTETTKFILQYLCSVTSSASNTWLEHQILESNTVLEAFGNSKTVKNLNSSRFGKFIQVCFDEKYQIKGCKIQDYLLEQSRITFQSKGERNYHVFYQLVAGAQACPELQSQFFLQPASTYNYLNQSECLQIEGVDDCEAFDQLRLAMSVCKMTSDQIDGIFSCLSSILLLGNLQFEETEDGESCRLNDRNPDKADSDILANVATLLGVNASRLTQSALQRQINVRGNITEIPFKAKEARENRHSQAKALYSRTFAWIVNHINISTQPGTDSSNLFLAVLDIFGFENFATNSFEQLCINHCNEKLHRFFNHYVFSLEQEMYEQEGIEFSHISFTDNTPCLNLLEKPPKCVFRLLTEECRMPNRTDETFVNKLHSEFGTHCNYIKGDDRRRWSLEFGIKHYAGVVIYTVNGFLDKNKDNQQDLLFDIMSESTNPFVKDLTRFQDLYGCFGTNKSALSSSSSTYGNLCNLANGNSNNSNSLSNGIQNLTNGHLTNGFAAASSNNSSSNSSQCSSANSTYGTASGQSIYGTMGSSAGTSKGKPTVADTFRQQLTALVDQLNLTNPWYVRCIKPNLDKCGNHYDDQQVLAQLRYLGMLDIIRIRREGYPTHYLFNQFSNRFKSILNQTRSVKINNQNALKICEQLISYSLNNLLSKSGRSISSINQADYYQLGKNKVFLKLNLHEVLEVEREILMHQSAIKIQALWRRFVVYREFNRLKKAAIIVQRQYRAIKQHLLFLRKRRAACTIQAYVRGMFAREYFVAMKEMARIQQREREEAEAKQAAEEAAAERAKELEIQRQLEEAEAAARTQLNAENGLINKQINVDEAIAFAQEQIESITKLMEQSGVLKRSSVNLESNGTTENNNAISLSSSNSSLITNGGLNNQVGDRNSIATLNGSQTDLVDLDKLFEFLTNLQKSDSSLSIANNNNQQSDKQTNQAQTNLSSSSTPSTTITTPSLITNEQLSPSICSLSSASVSSSGFSSAMSSTTLTTTNKANENENQNLNKDLSAEFDKLIQTNEQKLNELDQINDDLIDKTTTNEDENKKEVEKQNLINNNMNNNVNNNNIAQVKEQTLAETPPPPPPLSLLNNQSVNNNLTNNAQPQIQQTLMNGQQTNMNGTLLTNIALQQQQQHYMMNAMSNGIVSNGIAQQQQQHQMLLGLNQQNQQNNLNQTNNQLDERRKQRVERKLQQLKEEKQHQQTAVQTSSANSSIGNGNDLLEFAEKYFNNHSRDQNNSSMIKTLTRRKKTDNDNEAFSKTEMLSYTSNFNIPISHIRMQEQENSMLACSMFKELCKYMSQEMKQDSEHRIIQSILSRCIEREELRDELFVQLMRQITNNVNREEVVRLWVLIGLSTAAFTPSKSFAKYFIEFLRRNLRKESAISCYAQFSLDNLQPKTVVNCRRMAPSSQEIIAVKNLSSLLVKFHLLDGSIKTVDVHPADTANDVLSCLAQRINLKDLDGWALYEVNTISNIEKFIRSHHYIADYLAEWEQEAKESMIEKESIYDTAIRYGTLGTLGKSSNSTKSSELPISYKFILKKRLFKTRKMTKDPVEVNLLYAQAVHSVVKKDELSVSEHIALQLAGLQAQVNFGEFNNKRQADQYKDVGNYICRRILTKKQPNGQPKTDWHLRIREAHRQHGENKTDLIAKAWYLSVVVQYPLYGCSLFSVLYKGYNQLKNGRNRLLLGISYEGILILNNLQDKKIIAAYRYADIESVCSSQIDEENLITITLSKQCAQDQQAFRYLTFETMQKEDIASLIYSYAPDLNKNQNAFNLSRKSNGLLQNNVADNKQQTSAAGRRLLKMTLEDRMKIHQDLMNCRKIIIESGILRKPENAQIQENRGFMKSTLRRLNKSKLDKMNQEINFSADFEAECFQFYPHSFWSFSKQPITSSILVTADSELDRTAIQSFNSILKYSGLLITNPPQSSQQSSPTNSISSSSSLMLNGSLNSNLSHQQSTDSSSSSPVLSTATSELNQIQLAQLIIHRAMHKNSSDIFKNELFLQLIKQTTDHPEPNSKVNIKNWQLLALACSVTYPTDRKVVALLKAHLKRCALDEHTAEGQWAVFSLRAILGSIETRGRKWTPSRVEVRATLNRRRVYARIHFLDGQYQAVEFDACATISEVVEQVMIKVGLRPNCPGYALYQCLGGQYEQVLDSNEKVGDSLAYWERFHEEQLSIAANTINQNQSIVNGNALNGLNDQQTNSILSCQNAQAAARMQHLANMQHYFVFKKHLFLDSYIDLTDPVEKELLLHQIVHNIKNDKFPITDQEASMVCAFKAQLELGDASELNSDMSNPSSLAGSVSSGLNEVNCGIEPYITILNQCLPPRLLNLITPEQLRTQHQAMKGMDREMIKKSFFNLIQSWTLYRSVLFEVTQKYTTSLPKNLWLAIDQTGIHLLEVRSKNILASCEYKNIVDYNTSINSLMIVALGNNMSSKTIKYMFLTPQALQIAQLIRDYTSALAQKRGQVRRKSVEFDLLPKVQKPSTNMNGQMNGHGLNNNLNGSLNGQEMPQPNRSSLAQRQVHPMQAKINCPQNYYPPEKLYQMQNTIYMQKQAQQLNPLQLNSTQLNLQQQQQNNSTSQTQPQQQFHPTHRRSHSILYKTPVITQSENV